jgi:hypothetical protein
MAAGALMKTTPDQRLNFLLQLTRYRLFVKWQTVENHTVDFRGSPDFAEWRKLVGHCFAAPPEVEHVHEVVTGF